MSDQHPTGPGGTSPGAAEGGEYLEKRQLQRGQAGWVLLAGLGVAYVISGDFAGWNFGLESGGWGGLLVALVLMGTMYFAMIFALAEMASAIPATGGGYGFARRALGPLGGFATGMAILIEYALAPAAIVTFIGGYIAALDIGIPNAWWLYVVLYAIFIGIHLLGAGEALKVMFAVTAVAVVGLVLFLIGMIPSFDAANFTDIQGGAGGGLFPEGLSGIWVAFPFAIWFFLAVEGVPLAAEETKDPKRDLPRGMIAAMGILVLFAVLIMFVGVGGSGADVLKASDNPLPEALRAAGSTGLADVVNWIGLAGLVASFFSIMYGYSRQLFALSRAGYLPRALSVTTGRRIPAIALIVPGLIGLAVAIVVNVSGSETGGATILNMAVFGAAVSYVLMNVSHVVLRVREPELERPYRTPGGIVTSTVASFLAFLAVIATFFVDPFAAGLTLAVFVLFLVYFLVYSRHHLVAAAPEEEFEAIAAAERELERA